MKKQRILIVDDSELNREILAAMLEESYEIYEAEDGMQALEILEKDRNLFKLMLLDLRMPVMDGYQILAVMKEKQWLDTLPVICISDFRFIPHLLQSSHFSFYPFHGKMRAICF